jgi:5-oxoprolinase (ATP-hydrolysing)
MEAWWDGKDSMACVLFCLALLVELLVLAEPATMKTTKLPASGLTWEVSGQVLLPSNYSDINSGTSTDVSRYGGLLTHTLENVIAGVTVQTPQLDITTVAAGGGSILTYRNGLFNAGPQSAGAHPGPTCYRKGGPLTVTDANLVLGRLSADHFPKIFGPNENQPLDYDASRKAFEDLTEIVNNDLKKSGGKLLSVEDVCLGFLHVANESMCRPIRQITESKGYNTSDHNLASFGGAGGQHACVSTMGILSALLLI